MKLLKLFCAILLGALLSGSLNGGGLALAADPAWSFVYGVPSTVDTPDFPVYWAGGNAVCYDIQVSVNSESSWSDWLTCTTATSAVFSGSYGNTYYFRSRAKNSDGLWESYPIHPVDQTVVATRIYLPVTLKAYCPPLAYNELLRYNLTVIDAPAVWACARGSGVTVAVVDTGIDLDHPDLQANLVGGRSFVAGDSSPNDAVGHGTHVAGIVAAIANNGGVIGVAPEANLMPVRVLDASGSGSNYDVASGIVWAADNGADIINMSLGSISYSSVVDYAVTYAHDRGALLVASGGNCGDSAYYQNGCYYQDQSIYPAALWRTMAVASTDSGDNQSSFSTQSYYIDIAAPGSSIYSTYIGGWYIYASGTSMAGPHVAGLAALIWGQNPGLSRNQVRAQIENTAVDLGSAGWDSQFGYGRIDAAAAVNGLQTASTTAARPEQPPLLPAAADQGDFVPGEVVVRLETQVEPADVLGEVQGQSVQVAGVIADSNIQKWQVPPGQETAIRDQLRQSGEVRFAELNYLVWAQ